MICYESQRCNKSEVYEDSEQQETLYKGCSPATKKLRNSSRSIVSTTNRPWTEEKPLGFPKMAQLLQYIAGDVVKDYENNIKFRFVQYLNRLLEVLYNKRGVMATKDKQAIAPANKTANEPSPAARWRGRRWWRRRL
ncbi:hypothetical protein BASA82_000580 [Batrachochytrium salamandrivorans]|nr:hypothetical protein BASA82_000580 [Batrachochytrium salamandrivorans]